MAWVFGTRPAKEPDRSFDLKSRAERLTKPIPRHPGAVLSENETMAKNSGNGDAAKHEAQASAQAFLKDLATPATRVLDADGLVVLNEDSTPKVSQTLDEMFSVAANAVLVNVGTWVVPKRVPSEADFASRVELAFQD